MQYNTTSFISNIEHNYIITTMFYPTLGWLERIAKLMHVIQSTALLRNECMLFACDVVVHCLDFPVVVFHVDSAGGISDEKQ